MKWFGSLTLLLACGSALSCSDDGGTGPGNPPVIPPGTIFGTYLGGGNMETGRDIAVDDQGNLYITGHTLSPNFPTTAGAYDRTFNASGSFISDAFVAKLTPSGDLVWSTLLGGPDFERAYAIEVDNQGYVYVAGRAGPGFPVTAGVLQASFGGGAATPPYGPQDGFLCKIAPDGGSVVFCTYFGDDDYANIRDIAVGPGGDIWIIASSTTGNFPSQWFANAFQPTILGLRDAMIARISPDGSNVLWATYLGGTGNEENTNSIRVDAAGNAHVVLFTKSSDIPTPNGFDHTLGGPTDIYVGKISPDGSQLLYGTFVGGSGNEDTETHQLAIDQAGNAYVAGPTTSTDLPVTPGAFQTSVAATGKRHAFVAKISPTGGLLGLTYLAGSGNDAAEGMATDAQGNVYISGYTTSADFPVTVSGGMGGSEDVYLVELSPNLTTLIFSTRLGGNGADRGRGMIVDASGGATVVGQTSSTNLPVRNATQPNPGGGVDAFIAKLRQP